MTDSHLADRLALQDLMARYAAGVDDRDFALYASVFAEDVEVLGFGAETVQGRDAWVTYVRGALEKYRATQHMLGPQLATIDGDVAHCRTDVQAMHWLVQPEGEVFTLWATYQSEMVRGPEGWRIRRHRLVPRGTRQS